MIPVSVKSAPNDGIRHLPPAFIEMRKFSQSWALSSANMYQKNLISFFDYSTLVNLRINIGSKGEYVFISNIS